MFRLQHNVPEVYPDKSRDFQLFCRLYDVAFNSVKQSIDSLQNATSTSLCDASLLELLKDKLGFFTSFVDAEDEELRYILQAFPVIMRYKGSRRAIDYITNLYSRLVSSVSTSDAVTIDSSGSSYIIEVSSESPIVKTDLLFELLRYVLPTGYMIDYYVTYVESPVSKFNINTELSYNVTPFDPELTSSPVKTRIVIKQDVFDNGVLDESKEISNIVNIASVADTNKKLFEFGEHTL